MVGIGEQVLHRKQTEVHISRKRNDDRRVPDETKPKTDRANDSSILSLVSFRQRRG